MKTLCILITTFIICLTTAVTAQTRPAPPEPPTPPAVIYEDGTTRVTTNSSTSNVSVITQNGDYGKGGNTSFSVSNSEDEYSIKSRYPKNRYPALKEYLLAELGRKGLQSSGNDMVWSLEGDNETVYEVALSEKKLKVMLDKSLASPELTATFRNIGDIARTLISGGNKRQEISRLERDAERAYRDAERMQREAERLQAMSEREAAQLAREAERLSKEADKLSRVSKRAGGIDGYVRELLDKPFTRYVVETRDYKDWSWPAFQNALISKLNVNGLIDLKEDIVFVIEDDEMYVNGQRLTSYQGASIKDDLRFYNLENIRELSFYKKGDHIVVLNGPSDFDGLLDILEEKNLLPSKYKTTVVEINGASVIIDGKKQSDTQRALWNEVLQKDGVIPAPGKTIKLGKDFASLGYSFGKKTLGIWMSRE